MTAVFGGFGVCVGAYSSTVAKRSGMKAGAAIAATAAATVGVGAAPLGRHDSLHLAAAAAAYVSLAAAPLFASAKEEGFARPASIATSVGVGAALFTSFVGPDHVHGLFQRLGLTIGDAWIVATAVASLREASGSTLEVES